MQDPIPPYEGEPLARDVYENVQVLGDVPQGNFLRLMAAITEWVSPEQGCNYCHAGADQGNYADDGLYTKKVSRRMIQMTQHINAEWSDNHVAPAGVNCYTCHRGQNVPEYIWFEEPRPDGAAQLGANTMRQNRADETVGYASLPGDPLTKFLLEEYPIAVNGNAPRTDAPYEEQATIQDTEWTYGLMFHMSSSLGVNCTYCHNSRSLSQWPESPPFRTNAWYGIRMARDLNQNYLHPIDYYPPKRLGPLGDAPKANCSTCHQGVNQPMYGADMISQWPELAAPGAPDYSDWTERPFFAPSGPGRGAEKSPSRDCHAAPPRPTLQPEQVGERLGCAGSWASS
jgi:photosynthetic reaction center cytochrome c subunit